MDQKVVLGITRNNQGKVLIIKRQEQELGKKEVILQWAFPGGKVKPPETLKQTTQREVLKETGYQVKVKQLISKRKHPEFPAYIYYYHCQLISNHQKNIKSKEISESKWVNPNELESCFTSNLNPDIAKFLTYDS